MTGSAWDSALANLNASRLATMGTTKSWVRNYGIFRQKQCFVRWAIFVRVGFELLPWSSRYHPVTATLPENIIFCVTVFNDRYKLLPAVTNVTVTNRYKSFLVYRNKTWYTFWNDKSFFTVFRVSTILNDEKRLSRITTLIQAKGCFLTVF